MGVFEQDWIEQWRQLNGVEFSHGQGFITKQTRRLTIIYCC